MNVQTGRDETASWRPVTISSLFVGPAQREYARFVRVDAPLPGDLVIRCLRDDTRLRSGEVFVITHWPDPDTTVGGPYQSYGYALRQAHGMLKDRSERIWYDHAPPGRPEQLEQVGGHGHT